MSSSSIVLVGGPDSGKTNFLARFWLSALTSGSVLTAPTTPEDITYIEEALAHLHHGSFAPRTGQSETGSLTIPLKSSDADGQGVAELIVPDVSGELWHNAVELSEIPREWMDRLRVATGAVIFVRVQSDVNVPRLDWVTSRDLMDLAQASDSISTQVNLCEYVRFLEFAINLKSGKPKPRISVLITAWDLLDATSAQGGPIAYLEKEYPLFAGRIQDTDKFDVSVYGVSILGGDPVNEPSFREKLLVSNFSTAGYVRRLVEGEWVDTNDFTVPVGWAIGMTEPSNK